MSWDNVWEETFQNSEWGKYPGEDLIRFIARNFYNVKNREEIKILEVGCGPGANLWYLAREGFNCYGIDGSVTAVNKAKQRIFEETGKDMESNIIVGDIIKLPYKDEFFDAIIDNEAVSCNSLDNSKKIYNEAYRCLKKKGKLFVRTFADGCAGDTGNDEYDEVLEGPLKGKGFVRFTKQDTIPDLLNNFTILEKNFIIRSIDEIESGKVIREWIVNAIKE